MNKVKTYWFVEPRNTHSNEVIMKQLVLYGFGDENGAVLEINGTPTPVYSVPDYAFINRLDKDKHKLNLKFNVFCRRGKYGKIKVFQFADRNWKKKSSKLMHELQCIKDKLKK
jgi:hypothetical protein